MTTQEIENRHAQAAKKFAVAKQIREILDSAKKDYEKLGGDWDGEDLDSEIQNLVFEE